MHRYLVEFLCLLSLPYLAIKGKQSFDRLEHLLALENRVIETPLHQLPKSLKHMLVSSEDSAFYEHHGLDFGFLNENLKNYIQSEGAIKRGGSTLSQQLVKNIFLGPEKTLWRKTVEFFLTHEMEKRASKDKILEVYFNTVEWGPKVFGIKAAAMYYFKKDPSKLSSLESAFLITLLPSPIRYHASFKRLELSPFMKKSMAQKMALIGESIELDAIHLSFERLKLPDTQRPSDESF